MHIRTIWAIAMTLAAEPAAAADPLRAGIDDDLPRLVALYKDLHRAPELSFMEAETAKRLAAEIGGLGYEVTTGVGGHGIVAVMRNGPGPVLLLRADMDALPLAEETATIVAAASESHAIERAMAFGVQQVLAQHRGLWDLLEARASARGRY